ncbi:MAG: homoaconitate hydratase [Bacteroidetes bacterium GWA2_32_17]|nr:MAG: homoaconitate hydratase [Bacteroidetes bacterium GWA2_32_17]
MTIIEKIIANHSKQTKVKANDIIDIVIDSRVARDFGGANVVKNLVDNGLTIADASRTFFTFDCNPTGSDQKYAANQQFCRQYARENDIKIYDIDAGIGTHIAIDGGIAWPGSTFISTDSHANIMGAICSFGQGMGDQDIAAAWAKGSIWFKTPESIKLNFTGNLNKNISAKDFALNLLNIFGANKLLGFAVEFYGDAIDRLTLSDRVTIASMATEMGAIIFLFPPNKEVTNHCNKSTGKKIAIIFADDDAKYLDTINIDVTTFKPMLALPGHPHNNSPVEKEIGKKIDSAIIGSCTNGRIEDLRIAANILKNNKVAPGVVLKIVPATNDIWNKALSEGLIQIFKDAGAMVSNAGCSGCAAGQVGQNGPGEVTISTGNRNFEGKQGKGFVYLASPAIVAASAIAGFITTPEKIPSVPAIFNKTNLFSKTKEKIKLKKDVKSLIIEGKVWLILIDNIDTDMIFHNRYLAITDIKEMGQYSFDNLKGYEDFAKKAKPTDIVITSKNFGAGSSRQQAVDCFKSIGISCIIAESFGAIYERNAINAALPILTYNSKVIRDIEIKNNDTIRIDLIEGIITNLKNNKSAKIQKFNDVQIAIYKNGGLL